MFFIIIINCFSIIFLLVSKGLDKIEFLQSHENIEIYQKAFDMIDNFFNGDKEDARLAPTKRDKEYSFAPKDVNFQWTPDNF